MKLVLSIDEVHAIVRKHLGLTPEVKIDISTTSAPNHFEVCLRRAFNETHSLTGSPLSLTIARLKRFRELAGRRFNVECGRDMPIVGLADAKWAVENFDEAIRNIRLFGVIKT